MQISPDEIFLALNLEFKQNLNRIEVADTIHNLKNKNVLACLHFFPAMGNEILRLN